MKNVDIKKIVMLSTLAAIGAVLMVLIEIPYPFAPWLKIEFSDIVILITFSLYGFKSGLCVALIKTLCDLSFQGISGPYGIGQITALVASISYVFIIWILKVDMKNDSKGKIISKFIIVVMSVSFILTFANYLFITPIYSGELFWFQMNDGSSLGYDGSYIAAIIITYLPFNILKGTIIMSLFFIIFPRINKIFNKEISE